MQQYSVTVPPAEPLAPPIRETELSTGVPGAASTNIDDSTPPVAWKQIKQLYNNRNKK